MTQRIIDLFSCIGCHAVGFERAGLSAPIAMVEKNEFRRSVLARQWPEITIHSKVEDYSPPPADIVFGGPPCQETSVAAAIHKKELEKASGRKCCGSGSMPEQNGLSWSSRRDIRRGKPKCVVIFPALVSTSPDLSSALAMLARLTFVGESTWWPAPACRDWRSPGKRDHARLRQSRGQQMPEVLGTRISSSLYEWMLDLPEKWSDPNQP